MTNKKMIIRKAKQIRRKIKGVDLPLSIKLAKADRYDTADILRDNGFTLKYHFTSTCANGCCDIGHVDIYKGSRQVATLDFYDHSLVL